MNVKIFFSVLLMSALVSCSHSEVRPVKIANMVDPYKELGFDQRSIKEQADWAQKTGGKTAEFLASDLFLKGNDASMRGDFQTAVQLFRYIYQIKTTDNFVCKKLAIELIRLGELKEAEGILVSLYQKNSKDESIGLILAGVYSALEKPEYSKDIYKKLIVEHNSEEACLYLSKSYATDKNYKAAHALLIKCEKKNKDEPAFSFYRGKIEFERGNVAAKGLFEKSLKIDKTFTQAAIALGALYEEKEDFKSAEVEYKKFLNEEANSYNTTVLNKLVTLQLSLEKNKEVLPNLELLVALDPSDINLKVRLGLLYSEMTKYNEAIKAFKDVLEVVPESDKILYYLGALYQQMNNVDKAVEHFKKIQPVSPLYGDASVQIAQVYSGLAREDFVSGKSEKIASFHSYIDQRVKEHEELGLELKMVEAGFYDDTFQYPKAIEILSSYQANKNFTDSHSYYLASVMEKNGQFKDARVMIQKILERDPNNPHALNFLGYSYLEKNENMDVAFEYISKAVKLKPEDGYIRDSLAWYLYTVGKYNEALKEAKKAFDLVKTDAIIAKHLAKIYQSLNNLDKAHEYYAEALKNAKQDSEREDVLKQMNELEKVRMPASSSK